MKRCSKCKVDCLESEFHKQSDRKSGLSSQCKQCSRAKKLEHYHLNKDKYTTRKRNYRKRRRELIQSYKNKPCTDCNIQYPYYVMEFDHRSPKDKLFLISMAQYGWKPSGKKRYLKGSSSVSNEELITEIKKCDVVCANCHRERTYRRKNGIYSRSESA